MLNYSQILSPTKYRIQENKYINNKRRAKSMEELKSLFPHKVNDDFVQRGDLFVSVG